MTDPKDMVAERLRTIADILGIPIERLYDPEPAKRLSDTVECVRLWGDLRTDEGRAAVLDCLREALARERA